MTSLKPVHWLLLITVSFLAPAGLWAQEDPAEEDPHFCGMSVYLNLATADDYLGQHPELDPERGCSVFRVPKFEAFLIDWGVTHYKVGVGVSQASGSFSDRFGSTSLKGQEERWPFALIYHESGAVAQVGVLHQSLSGRELEREIVYQAKGLQVGVGWNFPLSPQVEINPMLTLLTGEALARVQVGPRYRPGDITVWGIEAPLHWDLGRWWGERNLFMGARLAAYSGGTQDPEIEAVFKSQMAYGLEFGGTFH